MAIVYHDGLNFGPNFGVVTCEQGLRACDFGTLKLGVGGAGKLQYPEVLISFYIKQIQFY